MQSRGNGIGVLFDWDGVVVDSHRQHECSWERLAGEENRRLPEGHFKAGFGQTNRTIIPEILGWSRDPAEVERLGRRKEALYRELVRETGLEPLPGARNLLRMLREAGIPCAIGTSTARENIRVALEVMGLEPYFKAIVCSEDVHSRKFNLRSVRLVRRLAIEFGLGKAISRLPRVSSGH